MTDIERKIISEIKELGFEEYGNYAFSDAIKNGISRVMFGKSVWGGTVYVFGNGCRRHHTSSYVPQLITDEQKAKVEKIYAGMVRNGYLRVSKSGEMAKLVKEA